MKKSKKTSQNVYVISLQLLNERTEENFLRGTMSSQRRDKALIQSTKIIPKNLNLQKSYKNVYFETNHRVIRQCRFDFIVLGAQTVLNF
jgi:hypothetical protein